MLRVFLEQIDGSPLAPLSLLRSVTDNDLNPLKSDFEDASFCDAALEMLQQEYGSTLPSSILCVIEDSFLIPSRTK